MSKLFKTKQFKLDLQLFNDGGATGGADAAPATSTVNAPKTEMKPSGSSRRSKSGEFENVVFGKQEGTTVDNTTSLDTEGNNPTGAGEGDVITTSDTLEERRKAFNDLINGEYKDVYQEKFQGVFDRRFKQVKAMEAELAAQKPILDKLMSGYGVDDIASLDKAFTEDRAFWERVAEEKGMTYEQYQAFQKIEMENKELKAFQQQQLGQARAQQQINIWNEQAQKVKELYPSFDLATEIKNIDFQKLLQRGLPMEHAYQVIHFDELQNNAAMVAAQNADAQAQARIKQKASRPSENGTSSQSAAIVRNDVKSLTRRERAEIARRVARGEHISF